jgi:hypothetical protein
MYACDFCVVLSCVVSGLAIGRSSVQAVLPECIRGFTVSEDNSDSEQARGLKSA